MDISELHIGMKVLTCAYGKTQIGTVMDIKPLNAYPVEVSFGDGYEWTPLKYDEVELIKEH